MASSNRNAINVLIKLLGGAEMTAELKNLGTSGEAAIKKIDTAAKGVSLASFGGALHDFGSDLVSTFERVVVGIGLIHAAVATAAPFVLLLTKSAAEAAEGSAKAAQGAGLQAEAYQKLAFAAGEANVDQGQFNTAMNTFNKQVIKTADETTKSAGKIGNALKQTGADIKQGVGYTVQAFSDIGVEVTRFGGKTDKITKATKDTSTAFDLLGINVKNTAGTLKSNEQLLLEVANAFQKMPDGANKSALAIKLFGLEGAKLIPFLDQGAKGIRALEDEAARLGIVFSDEQIKTAEAFNTSLGDLKKTVAGVARQIGLLFAPSFIAGANAFKEAIVRNRVAILDFVRNGVQTATVFIKDFFATLSGRDSDVTSNKWLIDWRDAIVGFGSDFVHVATAVVIPTMEKLHAAADLLTGAINAVFGTSITTGEVLIGAALIRIVGGFRLVYSAAVVAVEGIALFSRALAANPWLLAIAAVATGIALWATRTDSATAAMGAHQKIVDEVKAAYDRAQGAAKNWGDTIEHTTRDQALADFRNVTAAAAEARKALQDLSVGTGVAHLTGDDLKTAEQLRDLSKQFISTGGDVDLFKKKIQSIADASNAGPVKDYALAILNVADSLRTTETAVGQAKDIVTIFTGSAQEAQTAIEHLTGKSKDGFKPLVDSAKDANAAIDQTAAKVENLHTITVTTFGPGGPVKQIFDVAANGAAKAREGVALATSMMTDAEFEAARAAGTLGKSAAAAGQQIKGAGDDITNAIKPDAAASAVDGIVSDVSKIAPAAQDAASGVNDALGSIDAGSAEQAASAVVTPFDSLPGKIGSIMSGLQSLIQGGFSSLASIVSSLASQINAQIASILSALQAAAAAAASLRAQAAGSSSSSDSGGSHGGFAGGGAVRGPGGPKSDSILAWLSNGEYVFTAESVKRIGVGVLDAWNYGKDLFAGLRGFNIGGFVNDIGRSMAIPRLAGGGSVGAALAPAGSKVGSPSGLTTVRLDFGLGPQDVFDLIGEEHVAASLTRFAVRAGLVSTGRKPRRL